MLSDFPSPSAAHQPAAPRQIWRPFVSLPVIAAVAAGLRLGFLWQYAAHASHHALGVLPFLFEPGNVAYALASGHGFADPLRVASGATAWVAPAYPGLLAALFHIFGIYSFAAFLAAAMLNIAFTVLVCWPLYALGRRIGGIRAGALAAWLWAIYPNAILLPYQSMWSGCLAALLAATALWGVIALAETPRPRPIAWLGYGLLWGLILLTDPTLGVLLPLWLAWLLWRRGAGFRLAAGRLAGPVAVAAIAIGCALPWTLRNHRALHAWLPVRSDLGLALWLGNNPSSTYAWHGQQHPLDDAHQRALYLRQGEVVYMRQKLHSALAYMAAHPARDAALAWHRFWAFWSGGSPFPWRDVLHLRSAWNRYVLLFDLLAGFAGLFGAIRLFRRGSPRAFPPAVVPLLVPCAYYLTLATPRYRLPVDPVVLLLAALLFLPPGTSHQDDLSRGAEIAPSSGQPRGAGRSPARANAAPGRTRRFDSRVKLSSRADAAACYGVVWARR